MDYREERDLSKSFKVGSRVHILPKERDGLGVIHAVVVKRDGPRVLARDSEGNLHSHDYNCESLWYCHCPEPKKVASP